MVWTEEDKLHVEKLYNDWMKSELPQLYSSSGKYELVVEFYNEVNRASTKSIDDEYHGSVFLFGAPLKLIACQHYLNALKGNTHSAIAWFGCLDYLSGIDFQKYKKPLFNKHIHSSTENPFSYKEFMLSKRQFYYMSISELIFFGCTRKDACRRVASSYWLDKKRLVTNFTGVYTPTEVSKWMPNAASLHDQYFKIMKQFNGNEIDIDSMYPFLFAHKCILDFDGAMRLDDIYTAKFGNDNYGKSKQFEEDFFNFKMPIENKHEVLGKLYLKGRPETYKEK